MSGDEADLSAKALLAMRGAYPASNAGRVLAEFLRSELPIERGHREALADMLEPRELAQPRFEVRGMESGQRLQKTKTRVERQKLGQMVLDLIDGGMKARQAQELIAEQTSTGFESVRAAHSYAKKFREYCDTYEGERDSTNFDYVAFQLQFFSD